MLQLGGALPCQISPRHCHACKRHHDGRRAAASLQVDLLSYAPSKIDRSL
jgi:hypothetical protein